MRTIIEAIAMTGEQVVRTLVYIAVFIPALVMLAALMALASHAGAWTYGQLKGAVLWAVRRVRARRDEPTVVFVAGASWYRSVTENRAIVATSQAPSDHDPDWFPDPETIEWPAPWSRPYDQEQQA